MNDTREQIMNAAQEMIRAGGYHAFSFRQIADQLAIKSASVHYHFATKEALGAAVAERYRKRFLEGLGEPEKSGAIRRYVAVFCEALEADGRACLCGVLAGESGKLPESVRDIVRGFSEQNLDWLRRAIAERHPEWPAAKTAESATILFSALEGAMMFAALHEKPERLAEVGETLIALCDA